MNEMPERCQPFHADLSAWIDGELDAERAAGVRAHVAACARCGARVEGLRSVDDALRALPARAVPAELLDRTRARSAERLRVLPGGAPRRRRRLAPAGAALAAGLAGLAVWIGRPAGDSAPSASDPAGAPLAQVPSPAAEPAPAPRRAEPVEVASSREPEAPRVFGASAAAADVDDPTDQELVVGLEAEALGGLEWLEDLELIERLDFVEQLAALDPERD